jgi:hypothetical protein
MTREEVTRKLFHAQAACIVVGSYPMAQLGIRESRDLDIVISTEHNENELIKQLFPQLKEMPSPSGSWRLWTFPDKKPNVSFYERGRPGFDYADLWPDACKWDDDLGLWVWTLHTMLAAKVLADRMKDRRDIELVRRHLEKA